MSIFRERFDECDHRARFLPSAIVHGPAWPMLLYLAAREEEGFLVGTDEVCNATYAERTAGYRWLAIMEDRGIIVRVRESEDARHRNVRLTDKTRQALKDWADSVRQKVPA